MSVPDIIRVPSALGTNNIDGQCGPCNSDCTQDGSSWPRSPLSWFVIPRTDGNNLGPCCWIGDAATAAPSKCRRVRSVGSGISSTAIARKPRLRRRAEGQPEGHALTSRVVDHDDSIARLGYDHCTRFNGGLETGRALVVPSPVNDMDVTAQEILFRRRIHRAAG